MASPIMKLAAMMNKSYCNACLTRSISSCSSRLWTDSRSSDRERYQNSRLPTSQCHTDYANLFYQNVRPIHHSGPSCGNDNLTSMRNTKKKLVKIRVPKPTKKTRPVVSIHNNMTIKELAGVIGKDISHIRECLQSVPDGKLFARRKASVEIDNFNIITGVANMCGFRWIYNKEDYGNKEVEDKDAYKRPESELKRNTKRPPVITIMGHVDHGKTTLLDSLRNSNVVEQEFGGITQHIGAFNVKLSSGEEITFLDTPGHAAFTAMRGRGAMATDIVVLVVAADDGVMEQTVESIRLAKEANVSIIVAINKIDRPSSDVERTKELLIQHGLHPEDIGGDIQTVPISALKGTNLEALQEAIITEAELLELKADYTGLVEAVVIESRTVVGRGKLCTALVNVGTLQKGDFLVAGNSWAKVKGMFDDKGKPLKSVAPGRPVEIMGWKDLPSAGELILQMPSESRTKEVMSWRLAKMDERKSEDAYAIIKDKIDAHRIEYTEERNRLRLAGRRRTTIYKRNQQKEIAEESTVPELAIVVKTDVDGSLEAILDTLDTYSSDQCKLSIINFGVGPVTVQDVEMAEPFNGIVYRFNVDSTSEASQSATEKGVAVVHHNVIYKMIDDLKERLTNKLRKIEREDVIGEADVLDTFEINEKKKKIPIAGCRCLKGTLDKKAQFRLIRNEEVIGEGNLSSLKHFKKEVYTIKKDTECGVRFEDVEIIPERGDRILCFKTEEVEQTLDWNLKF